MDLLQYFYLAIVFYDTDGEQWFDSTSWVSNEPLCYWYGIKYNIDNIVTSIGLSTNNLSGVISSELDELRGL